MAIVNCEHSVQLGASFNAAPLQIRPTVVSNYALRDNSVDGKLVMHKQRFGSFNEKSCSSGSSFGDHICIAYTLTNLYMEVQYLKLLTLGCAAIMVHCCLIKLDITIGPVTLRDQ
jgi:hypothetical protein